MKIDQAVVDDALRFAAESMGVSRTEVREGLREPMVLFGDYIGVDLRGASDDVLRAFELRFWAHVTEVIESMTREEWFATPTTDVFDDAALQTVQELFGGSEQAS